MEIRISDIEKLVEYAMKRGFVIGVAGVISGMAVGLLAWHLHETKKKGEAKC